MKRLSYLFTALSLFGVLLAQPQLAKADSIARPGDPLPNNVGAPTVAIPVTSFAGPNVQNLSTKGNPGTFRKSTDTVVPVFVFVPEPGTVILLGSGLIGLIGLLGAAKRRLLV